MDTFTSIFTKKLMICLFSRVRHYLTITLRSPADNRGFFYFKNDFVHFYSLQFLIVVFFF
ncbi:hypothetical protein DPQ31_28110 [Bacillus sp. COPE52]|nr:hypothetical protein DPQ31_28110 [Bacillus sp. COPE52]